MRQAIDFAREIMRKKQVVRGCKSASLHQDYQKSVDRSVRELRYYCKEKGLDYRKVMTKAYNRAGAKRIDNSGTMPKKPKKKR